MKEVKINLLALGFGGTTSEEGCGPTTSYNDSFYQSVQNLLLIYNSVD
jgi:hypothetical protein